MPVPKRICLSDYACQCLGRYCLDFFREMQFLGATLASLKTESMTATNIRENITLPAFC
jgi:hypothetical protein